MAELGPGVYRGMSFEEYSRLPAANHSKLKHFSKTPCHARDAMLHDDESTKYQQLGQALHQALLEPDLFEENYLVAPKVDRRTKVGKAEWEAFEDRAKGRTIVSEEEMVCVAAVKANVVLHATAKECLYGVGLSELSIVWEDPATGVLCKARIDRLCTIGGWPVVLDLKSSHKPASLHSWQTSVMQYSLHTQAAHYLRGLAVLRPLEGDYQRKFAWLVVETERPYCVRMFEAEDAALSIGNDTIEKYLRMYAECQQTGIWPGWGDGLDLAGLPAWAYKQFDLE